MSRRRCPALSIVAPAPTDATPREFLFIVRTGKLDPKDGARLSDGILTVRAGDPLTEQLRAVEQVLRHYTDRPNELRPTNLPGAVTA